MKIDPEDTPCASERKGALASAVAKYEIEHARLLRQYEGRPLDMPYRHQVDVLRENLTKTVAPALPVRSRADALTLLALERRLLLEFEDDLTGIHGVRLAALEALQDFLQAPSDE